MVCVEPTTPGEGKFSLAAPTEGVEGRGGGEGRGELPWHHLGGLVWKSYQSESLLVYFPAMAQGHGEQDVWRADGSGGVLV